MTRPQAVETARRMYANGQGWTLTEIRRHLAGEGVVVCHDTVKGWVDPEWWQARLDRMRPATRRRGREKRGTTHFLILDADARGRLGLDHTRPSALTPELLLALRVEDKLSYSAIAAVVRRFFGEHMTEDQVRYRLYGLGAPKNQNKARVARAQHRRLKVAA